jgi:hypothetical protein
MANFGPDRSSTGSGGIGPPGITNKFGISVVRTTPSGGTSLDR